MMTQTRGRHRGVCGEKLKLTSSSLFARLLAFFFTRILEPRVIPNSASVGDIPAEDLPALISIPPSAICSTFALPFVLWAGWLEPAALE